MSARDDEWRRLLDLAVWGFDGEPERCSRCNADRGTEHSPTCPMPSEVIAPADALLDRLSHGRVTDQRLDQRLKANRSTPEATAPDTGSEYGRLLAERDRLISEGVDPADLASPLPPEATAPDARET